MLTKPLQLSQKVGLRKVTSWKVCKKARPSLEQMALARRRYPVSSSRLKEPLLGAETSLQHDWPFLPVPGILETQVSSSVGALGIRALTLGEGVGEDHGRQRGSCLRAAQSPQERWFLGLQGHNS